MYFTVFNTCNVLCPHQTNFRKGGLSLTTVWGKPMAFSEIEFVNYLLESEVMFSLCEPVTIPSYIFATYTCLHVALKQIGS